MNDRPLAACTECLCLASRRAARTITRHFDQALRPHGLRVTQFSVLVALDEAGPLTIGRLAKILGVERTTLSRNLAVIEKRGWVRLGADDDDARARVVALTQTGRSAAVGALPAWRQAQDFVAEGLGQSGAAALRRAAQRPGA